ncbi:MAG: (d)CMP kinase [Planctomycetota bacterium]|nr:(d)CMP kinase [Planctomycetota bacterium]
MTIDGPAGSGKSTLAPELASRMGWSHLDSGALYRVLAWLASRRGLDLTTTGTSIIHLADEVGIDLQRTATSQKFLVGGEDVTEGIRAPEVSHAASHVAKLPEIRDWVVRRLRGLADQSPDGVVADGRDMGTVVFPDAILKIFLEASADERARRRQKELAERGYEQTLDTVRMELLSRDDVDRNRAHSPMVPAKDAIHIDTTDCSVAEVTARVEKLIRRAVDDNNTQTNENAS